MTELDPNDQDSLKEQDPNSESPSSIIPIFEPIDSKTLTKGLLSEMPAILDKARPEDVLELIKIYQEQEFKLREIEIKNQQETRSQTSVNQQIALEKQHDLAMEQEKIRSQASVNTKELSKFAIGIFGVLFAGVLFYAHVAGDKALPDSIIKLMTGALAGGGGVTLLNQASQKDRKKE